MQRFFDRPDTRWREPSGCLHLYALPTERAAARADFTRAAAALAHLPGLGAQPVEYMHVTVQRFDAYVADLGDERWQHAWRTLGDTLTDHRPFELSFAPPRAGTHAVEAVAEVTDDWSRLGGDIRSAMTSCGLRHALTPAPYAPHYTLAYCVAPTADEDVHAALADAGTTTRLTVDRLCLVSVDQDPDGGVFRFETLKEWRLGR